MLKDLNLGRTSAIAAAIAAAGLMVPASAQSQVWYSEACIQYFRDYCAANWQSQGFASAAQCTDHYKETMCKGYTTYPDYLVPPSADRVD